MAWKSGFFNSVNGDRRYNAEQLSEIFNGLITDGVYMGVGNKLAVQTYSNMTIRILSGRGWFNGHWVNNDSDYYLDLEPADVTLNRYAAVVIKVDESNAVRNVTPYIKYGEKFSTEPSYPTPERTELIKEYFLAYIYIPAGATAITASYIEDTRRDSYLCGWVTGLIEQVDTDTLYTQWEALFFDWFNNLQDYLDEDVETKLVADMQELKEQVGGKVTKVTATISAHSWDWDGNEGYWSYASVQGVKGNSDVLISPVSASRDDYIKSECEAVSLYNNSIEFYCIEEPSADIELEITIINS